MKTLKELFRPWIAPGGCCSDQPFLVRFKDGRVANCLVAREAGNETLWVLHGETDSSWYGHRRLTKTQEREIESFAYLWEIEEEMNNETT